MGPSSNSDIICIFIMNQAKLQMNSTVSNHPVFSCIGNSRIDFLITSVFHEENTTPNKNNYYYLE